MDLLDRFFSFSTTYNVIKTQFYHHRNIKVIARSATNLIYFVQQLIPLQKITLGTCCARGLKLCHCDSLRSWPWLCLGDSLRSWPRLCRGDSLRLWPWASPRRLATLVASALPQGLAALVALALPRGLAALVAWALPRRLALLVALALPPGPVLYIIRIN